jgi:hypothetical protein
MIGAELLNIDEFLNYVFVIGAQINPARRPCVLLQASRFHGHLWGDENGFSALDACWLCP